MTGTRLRTFGEMAILREARRVGGAPVRGDRTALLALLASAGSAGISRHRVESMLAERDASLDWPALTAGIVAHLGADVVTVTEDGISLDLDRIEVDLQDFKDARDAGDHARAAHLHEARFLEGFHYAEAPAFDRWLAIERETLAAEAAAAAERLAVHATDRGEPAEAVRWWRLIAAQQPLNERIAARLMDAMVAAGDTEGARRHARFHEALVAEELDHPDDADVLSIAAALRRNDSDPIARFTKALEGRYVIEGDLGRGAFGRVLAATDRRHERPVAIKVLHGGVDPALAGGRFLREIRVVARLQHPHLLSLYDSGVAAGLVYYVMPRMADGSLRDRLERDGRLDLHDALLVARHVARGLDAAHAAGIVHRDLKPENILFNGAHAVLADFGAATASGDAEPRLTGDGMTVGTPYYMSPEQATASPTIDGRSDIYALGCVLYEMLGGQSPFGQRPPTRAMVAHVTAKAPSLATLRPALPLAILRAVERALEKDPARRFQSAREFERALAAAFRSSDALPFATETR